MRIDIIIRDIKTLRVWFNPVPVTIAQIMCRAS